MFAPERPRFVNGQPMYMRPDGSGIAPLLALDVSPCDPEGTDKVLFDVAGFWCYTQGTARYYSQTVDVIQLIELLNCYLEDPEAVMRHMGWSWSEKVKAAPAPKATISLEELGL